ncbi:MULTISPECIES: TIGR02449 family protein [Alcanivorax]|jgi:cell division protein ZapB|uniref:TIGR02449 family protein n=1 Tax=Alcanivorax jadensis T9 TaxID=1177181 RepID=A0ABR4WGA6_9GAMM|nr:MULTISPECIES: TIGR02449 family protein [Alcanivorax]KZX79820.1 TIGR02449 family protein [Alcanivorax sp. HI0013]KZX80143.1 TIGR02449 family protein [Alcanivorax sp. HI0011]KZY06809.1 TIGR02449 family protein [Alcanivorax sp. HI0035]MCS5564379.1 TIGR02449 family protein [Oleiphilaceae bacterium]MEE2603819.1 TIGR02449 family protein [Pseudomonadota bacterium]|tara:strand:- start:2809 stop:3021 length:213 start_codon:yes stop_codon:yes gene_type:complete
MTTEQQLRQLEARVDDLLRISARLRQENQSLHEREAKLVEERAQLLKKNDVARNKVEAIISRLKSLEQES